MEHRQRQNLIYLIIPTVFLMFFIWVGPAREGLFSGIAEITGTLLSFTIWMAIWNARSFSDNQHLMSLGAVFLWMGCFDLAYVVTGYEPALFREPQQFAAQVYVLGRLLQASLFLAFPLLSRARTRYQVQRVHYLYGGFFLVCLGLIGLSQAAAFPWLAPIKESMRWIWYLIFLMLLGAFVVLLRFRSWQRQFGYHIFAALGLLSGSTVLFLVSEQFSLKWLTTGAYFLQWLSIYFSYIGIVRVAIMAPSQNLKLSQAALRISEDRFDAFFNSVGIGLLLLDKNGRIVKNNPAALEIFGYDDNEFQQLNFTDLVYADDREPGNYMFSKLMTGKINKYYVENRFCKKEGFIWGSVTVSGLQDTANQGLHAIVMIEDITKDKQIQEELTAEKERSTVTLRSIGEGVIATDVEGNIIIINKAAEAITGWSQKECLGRSLNEVFYLINDQTSEQYTDIHQRVIQNNDSLEMSNNIVLVDRQLRERILGLSGSPIRNSNGEIIGVVLVFHDNTEKHKIEEELFKAAKLESLGVLAGGIAHDFNNILAEILANVQLARAMFKKDRDISKYLKDTEAAIERATALTKQLLTFAKGGAPVKKTASIADIIRDTTEFALRGTNVKCEITIADNLWSVEVDQGQISQVINNLVINAYQAMPNGGTIFVKAENVHVKRGSLIPKGKYIKLSIQDQGVGIPEELLTKIFDPYFTTKPRGNGLGLATSYSIIKRHGGYIDVQSKEGQGTCFNIYLQGSDHLLNSPDEAVDSFITGEGKVLLMDDDLNIRYLIGQMLEYIGYRVRLAQDGNELLDLYRQARESGDPFDVVILDLTVPGGKGGRETILELLEMDPKCKAIVSSGYSNDPVMADYQKYGFSGVVTKPYKINELAEAINKVVAKKQLKLALDTHNSALGQ